MPPATSRAAIDGGARVFKAHVQVGGYDPTDPLLDEVWGVIEEAQDSRRHPLRVGPAARVGTPARTRSRAVLARHPRLRLVVAHMGMPEYGDFLDLCERYDGVRLDTTMAFTPFVEETMPFPKSRARTGSPDLGDRILFGSDFPNIPYGYLDAMTALTRLDGVDDDWLRGVFHDNAARLFGLAPG